MTNEVLTAIRQRRSCRTFDPNRMPSDELIQQVAEAGTWAPTSRGMQNPIIVAVTNRELRDRIVRMNAAVMGTDSDPFYGAPCMLIVLVKKSENASYDGPIVMQNMMLAAHSLGIDSCWIHRAKEEFESEEGKALLRSLGINADDYIGIGHVALGYTTQPLPEPKPRKEDYIFWAK